MLLLPACAAALWDLANKSGDITWQQHARLALGLTHQALVLDRGRIVYRGDSMTLLNDAEQLDRLVAVS